MEPGAGGLSFLFYWRSFNIGHWTNNGHWTKWALDQMGIGPNGYWTKWALDQMGLDQLGLDEMGIGRNGFRRNGNKPLMGVALCNVNLQIMRLSNISKETHQNYTDCISESSLSCSFNPSTHPSKTVNPSIHDSSIAIRQYFYQLSGTIGNY